MKMILNAVVGHTGVVTVYQITLPEVAEWIEKTRMFSADFDYRDMRFQAYAKPPPERPAEHPLRPVLWRGRILKHTKGDPQLAGMDALIQFLASPEASAVQYIEAWEASQHCLYAAHVCNLPC